MAYAVDRDNLIEGVEVVVDYAPLDPVPPPRFGAAKSFAAYFILFFAQFLTGVVVMVAAIAVAAALGRDAKNPAFLRQLTGHVMAPTLLLSAIVSAIVILGVMRLWAWHLVRDVTTSGLGLVQAGSVALLEWSLVGAATGGLYVAMARWIIPPSSSTQFGPLAVAAASNGITRVAWIVLALAFAPVFEELFFRGLLLRGFTTSWGVTIGGCTVTALFVLGHLLETWAYWPATLAITTLAVAALAARQTSGSLIPAMAVHGTYNLVIVTAVLAGSVRV